MDLLVTLAGSEARWRFADSLQLETWLAARPWVEGGGVRLVETSGAEQARLLQEALPAAVHAWDQGRSNVVTRVLSEFSEKADARELVAAGLQGPAETSARRALEAGVRVLSEQQTLVVLDGTQLGEAAVRRFVDVATQACSDMAKLSPLAALTAVVLHPPGLRHSEPSWRFAFGGPTGELLGRADAPRSQQWASYLHTRLAWEVAGSLDAALQWNPYASALPPEDDAGLEALLNTLADEAWGGGPKAHHTLMGDYLRLLGAPWSREELSRATAALVAARLCWRPLGVGHSRPVPWVARALIRRGGLSPQARTLLRGCLTCAPLAREVLSRCLDMESYLRARHAGDLSPEASAQGLPEFEGFLGKDHETQGAFDRQFYPSGSAAVDALDASGFLTMGGFLRAVNVSKPRRNLMHTLRMLRNSVAHCHYVSWESLRLLGSLESQLGG
jgi:hypothetical protein